MLHLLALPVRLAYPACLSTRHSQAYEGYTDDACPLTLRAVQYSALLTEPSSRKYRTLLRRFPSCDVRGACRGPTCCEEGRCCGAMDSEARWPGKVPFLPPAAAHPLIPRLAVTERSITTTNNQQSITGLLFNVRGKT